MKISVIVPVYKVEEYISQCIDSILNQTFDDFELILVDDGSPDKSGIICDEYAQKDKRIVVIHKENGGLSSARNVGIDIAKGEYITFIDSDDYIHGKMLFVLLKYLECENADISICNYERTSSRTADFTPCDNYLSMSGIEAVKKLYSENSGIAFTTAWGKLYKKELFSKIRFPIGKYHEDEFTTYKLLYNSSKVVYTENKLYFYYINSQSIIQSKFSEKNLDSLDAFKERILFFEEKNNELCKLSKQILVKRIMYCYQRIQGEKKVANKTNIKKKILQYLNTDNKAEYLKSVSGKQKIWTKIFFFSPLIYSSIRNLLKIGL